MRDFCPNAFVFTAIDIRQLLVSEINVLNETIDFLKRQCQEEVERISHLKQWTQYFVCVDGNKASSLYNI